MSAAIDVYLVRHGEAALPWSAAKNAGLSEFGRRQAQQVAGELAPLRPLQIISSPLLRAQQTAVPLGRHWDVAARIDRRYREVPLAARTAIRRAWLNDVTHARWHQVGDAITAWRSAAWEALLALEHSTVIFTHFMLINAIVTRATGDDRLVCFEPDYASVTRLRVARGTQCEVLSFGRSL